MDPDEPTRSPSGELSPTSTTTQTNASGRISAWVASTIAGLSLSLVLVVIVSITVVCVALVRRKVTEPEPIFLREEQNTSGMKENDTNTSHCSKLSDTIPFVDPVTVKGGQDMELTENQAYAATPNIPVKPNECVTMTPSVDTDQLYDTVEGEHQQQDMELKVNQAYTATPNIPVEPNQCYGTMTPSVDPDELYATVEGEHQQQDMELGVNQAYAATPNIPVKPNQCYGTMTPSVDPDNSGTGTQSHTHLPIANCREI